MNDPDPAAVKLIATEPAVVALDDAVAGAVLERPLRRGWLGGFLLAFALLNLLLVSVGWLFNKGVGIWGIDIPVAWGFAIINLDRKSVV